jgi:uncharacterized membrane protein
MIRSFESQNGENEMWNSFICGADFYFIDFAVSINLYVAHEDKPKFTKLRQLVEMTATNAFSKESVIIELITLHPSMQTLDAVILFSLFIIVIVLWILCLTQNWTTKIKLPESLEKERERISLGGQYLTNEHANHDNRFEHQLVFFLKKARHLSGRAAA